MRILKILLSVILVVVIGFVALIFLLPGEKIAGLAADQVKGQTGRDLTFDGDVSISVFPTLGVSTGPVALSNAPWSEHDQMFTAQSAKIGVDFMSVLGGDIKIKEIVLTSPNILLEQDGAGNANWDLLPAGDAAEEDHGAEGANEDGAGFTLDNLKVTDAQVRYLDGAGQDIVIKDLDADLSWGSGAAELTLSAVPAEDTVSFKAAFADLTGLLAGEISEVSAQIEAAGNEIEFAGRASLTPEMAGSISVALPKPAAFTAALGLGAQALPATTFDGDVTFTKEQLFSLRDGKITVAGNALSAEADVDLSGKPVVTANIQAGALNLAPLMGGDSSGSDSASSDGWPTDPIDASALAAIDGSIAISASSLDLGTLKFGASRLNVEIDNARAVATLQQLNGYDGTVSGQFVLNNRSGFSVGGNMKLAGLELNGLMSDLVDVDRFTGQADAELSFLGSGQSVHAIMNSLRGDGALNVGQGTISGIDLDKLFRGTASGGTTVFDSMSATWTISGGVLSNDDLRMELPNVLAKGDGTIGLGGQVIDYTLTPQIRNDAETGLSFPVRVKGPWSSPKIWPDLEAVIEQNFEEEKEKLEEKAKEAVADKLGVQLEDGQKVEDALEEKLEDEVKKQLNKLFGNN